MAFHDYVSIFINVQEFWKFRMNWHNLVCLIYIRI